MLSLLVLLLALVAVGLGFFTVQNTATATIHFWSWTWHVPVWYIPVAAAVSVFAAFVIYSMLVGTKWRVRHLLLYRSRAERQMTVEELRSENAELREEVARLSGRPNQAPRAGSTARAEGAVTPPAGGDGLSRTRGAARRLLRLK